MAELAEVQPAVIPAEIPASVVAAPITAAPETPTVAVGADPAAIVEPAPGVDGAPSLPGAEKSVVPEREPTLLEKFDADAKKAAEPEAPKPEAEKPVEPAPVEAEKPPVEEPAAPEPVTLEPIDYFAAETGIKLPETLTLDDATREKTVTAFDAFRANPAAGAQGLIDLHNEQMQAYADHLTREQHRVFNETRKGWVTEVMADPVLGGAGYQTAMARIAGARDVLVSNAKPGTPQYIADRARMEEFLAVTGAGDHPWFLGMMHRASKYVGEPAMPPPNPRPPKDLGKQGSKLYDHPSSQTGR